MYVIIIPIKPEHKPIIKVSALNTRVISFFLAPSALNIPISLVRSNTEIYVIIPIIIEDTTRDIAEKAIKNKTGARGLRTIMEDILLNIMYTVPDKVQDKSGTLRITKECIEDGADPILEIKDITVEQKGEIFSEAV